MHKRVILLVASVSVVALQSPALAQTESVPPGQQPGGLGDIVVTAQKREQAINDVPLSITAASGEKRVNQGISNVADLVKIVPGLNYTESAFVRNLGNTYDWSNATRITDTTVRFAGRLRTFGATLSAR